VIAPQRKRCCKQSTQDESKIRLCKQRWKVERLFAWLQDFLHLVVRYDYNADNFLSFLLLGFSIILIRFFEIGSNKKAIFLKLALDIFRIILQSDEIFKGLLILKVVHTFIFAP